MQMEKVKYDYFVWVAEIVFSNKWQKVISRVVIHNGR